jgi:hypothetical protein
MLTVRAGINPLHPEGDAMTKYLPAAALLAATTYLTLSHLTSRGEPGPNTRIPAYTDEEMRAIYARQRELDEKAEAGRHFQAELSAVVLGLRENRASLPDAAAAVEAAARRHNLGFLDQLHSRYGHRLDVRQSVTLTLLLHLHAARRHHEHGAAEAYQRVLGELDRWPADRADFIRKAVASEY